MEVIFVMTRAAMLIFAAYRADTDTYLITKGIRPNHFINGLYTILMASLLALIGSKDHLLYNFISLLLLYWVAFDLLLNRLRNLPWYYTGVKEEPDSEDNALTDQLLTWIGPKIGVLLKVILLIGFSYLALFGKGFDMFSELGTFVKLFPTYF